MIITIETTIKAPLDKVWEYWTKPEHITNWNFATNEWCCPSAINDLRPGVKFNWRMDTKDGSMGFDFVGTYDQIIINEKITFKTSDGRNMKIQFSQVGRGVVLSEAFEAEGTNSDEQQRAGWQAILDNYKMYVEAH